MLRNTIKNTILFLIGRYDCVNINNVVVENNSVVVEACAICGTSQVLKEYSNRFVAIYQAYIYSKNNETVLIGLCEECSNDPDVVQRIWGD